MKVLARTRAASIIGSNGGHNMRVHFQQLTEPIVALVDNYPHERFEVPRPHSQIPQLKSPAPRSRTPAKHLERVAIRSVQHVAPELMRLSTPSTCRAKPNCGRSNSEVWIHHFTLEKGTRT